MFSLHENMYYVYIYKLKITRGHTRKVERHFLPRPVVTAQGAIVLN